MVRGFWEGKGRKWDLGVISFGRGGKLEGKEGGEGKADNLCSRPPFFASLPIFRKAKKKGGREGIHSTFADTSGDLLSIFLILLIQSKYNNNNIRRRRRSTTDNIGSFPPQGKGGEEEEPISCALEFPEKGEDAKMLHSCKVVRFLPIVLITWMRG